MRPPDCAKRSSGDLGRTPDFVFLHSPERTLARLPTSEGRRQLAAAFRIAYQLPPVVRVAVGTSNPAHLRELIAATELVVNDDAIDRYQQLIQTLVSRATES